VEGIVVAHRPWGLEVELIPAGVLATVDLRFIDDETVVIGDQMRWPAIGTRVHGKLQGIMPNGQKRVSLRLSDAPQF
jgi:hypothetical protein